MPNIIIVFYYKTELCCLLNIFSIDLAMAIFWMWQWWKWSYHAVNCSCTGASQRLYK